MFDSMCLRKLEDSFKEIRPCFIALEIHTMTCSSSNLFAQFDASFDVKLLLNYSKRQ